MLMDLKEKYAFRDVPGGPVVKTRAPNAAEPGSIPGQGARSHMAQLKSSHAATKEWALVPPLRPEAAK